MMQNSLAHSNAEISPMEVYGAVEGSDTDVSNDEGADVEVFFPNGNADANTNNSCSINIESNDNINDDENLSYDTEHDDTNDVDTYDNDANNNVNDNSLDDSHTAYSDKTLVTSNVDKNRALDKIEGNGDASDNNVTGTESSRTGDNFQNDNQNNEFWTTRMKWKMIILLPIVIGGVFYLFYYLAPNNNFSPNSDFSRKIDPYPTSSPVYEFSPPLSQYPTESPSHNPISSPTHSPSLSKDLSPTSPPSKYCATTDAVIEIIKSISSNVNTKAKEWILSEHNQKLDTCKDLISITQRYILSLLYYSTSGDNWYNKRNWLTNASECDWEFITCEDKNVTHILLDNNNLNGTIPSEISKLISLQNIDFTTNVLYGTLPPELFSLSLLLYFDVSYNSLIGQVFPNESFKAISQLEALFLESNNFGSTIPKKIGELKMLQYLSIERNNLSGSTPAEMANLNKLKYLNLEKNNLNGTIGEYLFLFPDFDFLYLSNNAFSGTIPSWNGSKLSDIWLDNNELKGRIPSGNLPKIEELLIQKNLLTGPVPDSICDHSPLPIVRADCKATVLNETTLRNPCRCCATCCNNAGKCSRVKKNGMS